MVDSNAVSTEGTTDSSDPIVAVGINKNAPCSFLDLDAGALEAWQAVSMDSNSHRYIVGEDYIAAKDSA